MATLTSTDQLRSDAPENRLTAAPINTGLENLSNLAALADFYAEAAADGVSLVTLFLRP